MLRKTKFYLVILSCLVIVGLAVIQTNNPAGAVTDTCTGVNTTFTGSAPSSVTAGQSFTISNITSRPDNSYGYTITSSTLNLSATNATPATYSQNDTSTDPSPTTGAATYTAYYPNWTLTAGSSAGSTITVKLVSASAHVLINGTDTPITCPLTATLATISVTAASSPSSGTGSTTPNSAKTNNNTATPAPTATPSSPAADQPQTNGSTTGTTQTGQASTPAATAKPSRAARILRRATYEAIVIEVAAIATMVYLIIRQRQASAKKRVPTPTTSEPPHGNRPPAAPANPQQT